MTLRYQYLANAEPLTPGITPITATVKAKGKGIPPLRLPVTGSVSFTAGSQAVVTVASDFTGTAEFFTGAGISQGAMTLDARANNAGNIQSLIFSQYVPSSGSYYAVFTMSSPGVAAGALIEIANVAVSSQLDQIAVGTGTSASPSSGATSATTQNYEIIIGAVATEGPGSDIKGSWSNSFQPIVYIGTLGAAPTANTTLSLGYKIVGTTGAQTSAKTGITSRDWGAATATYKGFVAVAPVITPSLAYLSESPLDSGALAAEYNEFVQATGGVTPYTFAVTAGSLPSGLSLSTDGNITGIPTATGVSTPTITVTDSAAATLPKVFQITITGAAPVTVVPGTWFLPPTTQIPVNIQILPQV